MQIYKLDREVKKKLTGKSQLRRWRSALVCSAIQDEETEEEVYLICDDYKMQTI